MTKTTVQVEGMMCGNCEKHVNNALNSAFSLKKVTSSHDKNLTEIISESPLDEEKVRQTIESAGYKAVSVSSEPYEKKFSLFGNK